MATRSSHENEILLEISLSIGRSLDLEKMLRQSLHTIMRQLNAQGAAVLCPETAAQCASGSAASPENIARWQAVFSVPRIFLSNADNKQLMANMVLPEDTAQLRRFYTTAPFQQQLEELTFLIFPLRGFGLLILRRAEPIPNESLIQSLHVLMDKLANAAIACLHEANLQKQVHAAEAANLAKSQFLANMSHEIRTPINGIMGSIDLVLETPLTPGQTESLEQARFSARHLLGLMNQVLDLSKIEAGKLELQTQTIDLAKYIKGIIHTVEGQARAKNISLHYKVSDLLPSRVIASPTALQQALLNLIGNAIKFTHEGRVTLTVTRGNDQAANARGLTPLRFTVEDSGIGIPADELKNVFRRFEQLDADTTRRFGGAGLGLTITHELIERMGGKISVSSRLNRGSTFTIDLNLAIPTQPASDEAAAKCEAPPSPADRPGLSDATIRQLLRQRQLRILVAEDNKVNQKVLTSLLQKLDVTCVIAEDGGEAVELFAQQRFDLVLMDMMMPVIDGLEATRQIRQQERDAAAASCPVIAVTANAMKGAREEYLSAGIDGYIAKPLDMACLCREMSDVLKLTKQVHADVQVDWHDAVDKAGGEELVLAEALEDFLKALPEYLSDLQHYLAGMRQEQLQRSAHTLAGLCATFGMRSAAEAARRLQYACRDGATSRVLQELTNSLDTQISASRAQVLAFRQQQC